MKIKTIDVEAKEWFDKVNGNSYFSGVITINFGMKNQKQYIMPFQYGYGSQYEYEALNTILKNEGLTALPYYSLNSFCKENKIILRKSIQTNCKKKELQQ